MFFVFFYTKKSVYSQLVKKIAEIRQKFNVNHLIFVLTNTKIRDLNADVEEYVNFSKTKLVNNAYISTASEFDPITKCDKDFGIIDLKFKFKGKNHRHSLDLGTGMVKSFRDCNGYTDRIITDEDYNGYSLDVNSL